MALIRNGVSLSGNPCRISAAPGVYGITRSTLTPPGSMRGFDCGPGTVIAGASISDTAGRPNGLDVGAWLLPRKGGGLAAYTSIEHAHELAAGLAMGAGIEAALAADCAVTSDLSLVVACACAMLADCEVSADAQAIAVLASTLAASGDLVGAMDALAHLSAEMLEDCALSGTVLGVLSMAAELSTSGDVAAPPPSAEAIAAAVWAQVLTGAITTATAEDMLARITLPAAIPVTAGTVTANAGNTSAIFTTDLEETASAYWRDALCVIVDGALAGQVKKVQGYNGTTKALTVGPSGGFTSTPAAGTAFVLINR